MNGQKVLLLPICILIGLKGVFASVRNIPVDTTSHINLKEIVVKAHADFFKVKGPNKFVYEVSKDAFLHDAMAIDAMRNVPILNTSRSGEVTAMNGSKLVFKINGLKDPLLSNLPEAMTTIPANAIKSIEFTYDVTGEGTNVVEVNIITKGRLEGYRMQLTSNLSDSKWKNGIWAMSKVRRLTFHGSYFNTWEWSHKTTYGSDEYRYATPELYRYETIGEQSGYKVDLHNFEAGLTYNIDDNSFLNFYGGAMLKTDPRTNSLSTHNIFNSDGMTALSYENINKTRMNDAEYTASVKYERDYSSMHPAHLNIGYEFYSRPLHSMYSNIYESIDCKTDADIGFLNLNNSTLKLNKSYITNTLVGEWQKKISQRVLFEFYAKLRTRHESYENTMDCHTQSLTKESQEYFKTSLNEYFGILTPKFLYFTNWWEIRVGTVIEAYRHAVNATDITGDINNNKTYVLPYVSLGILTKRKMTIRLSYNMGNSIPDVTALDPYVDTSTPGEIKYGNPYLKPQTNHSIKLDVEGKTGKLYSGGAITYSQVNDIILSYKFVQDGLLNRTFGNVANRRGVEFSGYTSGRLYPNTYLRINATIDWNQYRADMLSIGNKGWRFWTRLKVEQELPWGLSFDASMSYSTRAVLLQGNGSHNINYSIGLFKQFLKRSLTVYVDASSFYPIWFEKNYTTYATNYSAMSWNRNYQASFSLSIRYTFGKLRSQEKENSFDIKNTEIKIDYSE